MFAFFFLTLVQVAAGEEIDVFHQVDTQKTFWEGMHGEKDGPIAVTGTRAITDNVAMLARVAQLSSRVKSISSRDRRFPAEGRIYAKDGVAGAEGPERIPEVEVYWRDKQLDVPHHSQKEGALALVPFDVNKVAATIRDPGVEVVIEKNGMNAYDVFANPRTAKIYSLLKPKHVYVYGVATDWCVGGAVNSLLDHGYAVSVVTDAIAGVNEKESQLLLSTLEKRGAKMVKTSDVLALYPAEAARARHTVNAGLPCELGRLAPK